MRLPPHCRGRPIATLQWCPRDLMSFPSSADATLPLPALPKTDSLAIHLDLVGGISGDMFVAAMADALPELSSEVLAEVDKVRADGDRSAAFIETSSGGL